MYQQHRKPPIHVSAVFAYSAPGLRGILQADIA
jgi:hypothetical protein